MPKWKPGSGRAPTQEEAGAYGDWVEEKPETRYQPLKGPERGAVTGVTPNKEGRGEQLAMFPDETSLPEMKLEQHSDAPKSRRERNEASAAEMAGTSVRNMNRKAQYDVDSALAAGRSPEFYEKTARNQVGQMAQRTGVDYQTAAAATATTSPQRPWMLGSREVNIEMAEAEIERTVRSGAVARQEVHKPNPAFDAARDREREHRWQNVLEPSLQENTATVSSKTQAVVEFGAAGFDPAEARWGGVSGTGDKPVFGPGLKETSFYQNFRQPNNPENRVTFDRHMSDSLVGRSKGDDFRKGQARYRIGAEAYGKAADKAGISREGAQAAAWTQVKAQKGHEGGSYDESGQGLSYMERQRVHQASPQMFTRRGDEEIPSRHVR